MVTYPDPCGSRDRVVSEVADEVHRQSTISDRLWESFSDRFSTDEMVEVFMLVGQHHLVPYVLNGFCVEVDDRLEPPPPT